MKLFIILYTVIVVFFSMYSLQPILPLMAEDFGVPMSVAAYTNSLIFIPLCVAPIFYGYILEHFRARYIMVFSLFAISFFGVLIAFTKNFELVLVYRVAQAVFFPAALTITLTLLSRHDANNVKKYMGFYISATVFGGMVGRLLGGFLSDLFSWQEMFIFVSALSALGGILYLFLHENTIIKNKISPESILSILRNKHYLYVYISISLVYFMLAGILNMLPFRAKELSNGNISETAIGVLYFGFFSGVLLPMLVHKFAIFADYLRSFLFFISLCFLALLLLLIPSVEVIFWVMFVFCAGVFGSHNIATIYVNHLSIEKKALTNGFYLSFYYLGGIFGAQIPVMIYEQSSFSSAILFLCFVAVVAFGVVFSLRKMN